MPGRLPDFALYGANGMDGNVHAPRVWKGERRLLRLPVACFAAGPFSMHGAGYFFALPIGLEGALTEGLYQALRLIVSADPELLRIILLSLRVSSIAIIVSALVGVPLGAWLGLRRFIGRRLAIALLYTGMGFPPVVVGLAVYLLLSRSGPLGALGWPWLPHLFTPDAMVIAQIIIAIPLVSGFTMAAVMGVDPNLRLQLVSLGATPWQATCAVLREARVGVVVSIVAGFGSIISEVGAVMLVGGNIEGATRVLTTAIVLETRKGNFDLALAMGVVLLALTFAINATVLRLQGKAYD